MAEQKLIEMYGKRFPAQIQHRFQVELWCWANYEHLKNPEFERWRHLKNAILLLDEEMRTGWNDWTEMMCWAYGSYDYIAAMGCTASTKTHTFHKLGFYDYMSSPLKTAVTCTTTNSAGLEQRMWPVMSSSFLKLKRAGLDPGWKMTVAPQRMIRCTESETKHVIRAVTIDERADQQKIVDQLIGVHVPRRIWIVDEGTSAPPAVMDAWGNAMASTTHKRLVMLGNPHDQSDTMGVFSEPINGWSSVNEDTEKWEFMFYGGKGCGLHFHGAKSPNLKYPKKANGNSRWPWLYDHATLEAHMAIMKVNPITYWRMCIGWFMPEGISRRVCSMAAIDRFKCKEKPLFKGGDTEEFLALDPAFGGDRCILGRFRKGMELTVKKICMGLMERYEIPIDPKRMPGEQIGQYCIEIAKKHGIKVIGIDTTTNNSAAAEYITTHSDLKVFWIPFGGSASDERKVSDNDDRTCKEAYYNKAAELAFAVANRLEIIKGLDQDICAELCSRYWEPIGEKPTRQKLETKEEYKARMKKSPDLADMLAVGVEVFHLLGGTDTKPAYQRSSNWNKAVKKVNSIWTSNYKAA